MTTKPFYSSPKSLTKWVKPMSLDECREKYREFVHLERKNGIIVCRMHTNNGPTKFGLEWHAAMPMLWRDLGSDPENEVLILTGTGNVWMAEIDVESHKAFNLNVNGYDHYIHDGTMLIEGFLNNIDIPIIAAVNGPGLHVELAFLSDIVICADHAMFFDPHFPNNAVPGDGLLYTLIERIGITRAAHLAYLGGSIDGPKAVEWGLVQESMPLDKLMGRAWEIAEVIMQRPRAVRRLTHLVMKRRWKEIMHKELGFGIANEVAAMLFDWHPVGDPDHPLTKAATKDK